MEILIHTMAMITLAALAVMFCLDVALLIASLIREAWLAAGKRPATGGPAMIPVATPAAAHVLSRSFSTRFSVFETAALCRQGVLTHGQEL